MIESVLEPSVNVQEKMWIEIIQQMEAVYAELAQTTVEIEKKNLELTRAQELTDSIMRSMVDALVVLDSNGMIQAANQATLKLTGFSQKELLGKPMEVLFHIESAGGLMFQGPRIQSLFRKESSLDLEVDFMSKTGERIPMNLRGSLLKDNTGEITGVLMVARDLRQIKKLLSEAAAADAHRAKADELEKAYLDLQQLQTRLIQTEKMASLGKLSAGVAHEINNPLGGIMLYSHLLLEDVNKGKPSLQKENLEKIVKLAARSKEIVKNLLDFARQSEPRTETHHIHDILEGVLSILEKQVLFHNVKIERKYDNALPPVHVDAAQMQQVFMNIFINAAEAMNGQGSLVIHTGPAEGKNQVFIQIADTGPGIPREHISQLFEPFFTTKKAGEGTGLGLSICYGIIRRHRGRIEVDSETGRGTAFTIFLPVEA